MGDWLADIVTGMKRYDVEAARKGNVEDPFVAAPTLSVQRPTFQLQHHPSQTTLRLTKDTSTQKPSSIPHTRRPIVPQTPPLLTHPNAGMGRIVTFTTPQPLPKLLDLIGRGLNNPKGFPIAIPQGTSIADLSIRSVGICAGSGGSLLSGLEDVDLLFTGEMSHHEALRAIEEGKVVVSLFHSNSERGFLSEVLRGQLEGEVGVECVKKCLYDKNIHFLGLGLIFSWISVIYLVYPCLNSSI